jgi:hypothetical protein
MPQEEVFSTQIDELPEESDYGEENQRCIDENTNEPIKIKPKKHQEVSMILDSSILFFISMLVTNRRFVKWISQFNFVMSKGSIMLSLVLSFIITVFFIVYRLVYLL